MPRLRRFGAFRLVAPTGPPPRAAALLRWRLRVATPRRDEPARHDPRAAARIASVLPAHCRAPLAPAPLRWRAWRDPPYWPAAAPVVRAFDRHRRLFRSTQERQRRIVRRPVLPRRLLLLRAARCPLAPGSTTADPPRRHVPSRTRSSIAVLSDTRSPPGHPPSASRRRP